LRRYHEVDGLHLSSAYDVEGARVAALANIELPEDVRDNLSSGARGGGMG
jgi:hypothetical protein